MNQPTCPKCGAALPPDAPAGLCPKCLLAAGFESQPVGPADPAATEASPAPAAGFVPPTPAELAARFPQLEVLELLGKGGMGAVYKARQPGLDRLVAIKILPPEISRAPGFAERFMREARALARLSHPHIVAVYDFGQVDGLYYFIMEYVDGVNLRQAIQAGSMNPPQALAIVPQICEALQFAHDEGVVHRDIKPENVLIDKRGRVKIADFGLAKLAGHEAAELSLTGTHQVMGTVRYMAPEQLEGSKSVDHRADIYSLGVVFYELLTGELPLGRFAPPSQRVQLDVRLDEVVLRALEKEPAQRYQHASELKTRVDEISTSGGQRVAAGAASPGRVTDLAPPAPDARLSKCALVGALWASMCVPGLLATATMWLSRSVSSIPPLPANMQVHDAPLNLAFGSVPLKLVAPTFGFLISPAGLLLAIVAGILGLMGLTAPLGTTTLGVVAISQIRHSRGKLYGMRLAVFDALLFPLLLLDGLLFVFSALVAMAVLSSLLGDKVPQWSSALLPFLISLPIIAWVDWRIARAVWRMAIGYQAADVAKPRGDIAPRRGFLARCLAGPEQPFQASYTRWVFLPMLVLVGLWLVVAVIVQIKYGHPNDYHPIVIADTHTLAGLGFVLTLPALLLVRWMQQLPGGAYLTLAKRLALCVVCLALGIVAWTVAFTSPWNHVHVQSETVNFVPRSKAYQDLLLTAEWFSHERTKPPYVEPDGCELRLWLRSSDTLLLRVLDVDLRGHKDIRRGHEGPLTREKYDRWTKEGPLLDTSNPAIKQELDELFLLVSTYPASVPVSWDSFLTFARTTLAHYDLGDYRHSGTSVRPENFTPFLWALLALPIGFLLAVAVSVGAARRSLVAAARPPALDTRKRGGLAAATRASAKLLQQGWFRAVLWTLGCAVLYCIVWFPNALVDRYAWPYTGDSVSTVSLIPKSKAYDRLLIREHLQTRSQGWEEAFRQHGHTGGRPGAATSYQFTIDVASGGKSLASFEIDALDNMAWHYHDSKGELRTGQPIDRIAISTWLKGAGLTTTDEEADAIVNTITKTAADQHPSSVYDTGEHNPVGRLEQAVYSQGAALKTIGKFPFTSSAGTEKNEGGPVGSLLWTGLLVTLALWIAGLFWITRRQRTGATAIELAQQTPLARQAVAEPVAAAAQPAAAKLTARAYWLTFGVMALAWWLLPLMWPLGNIGLLVACLLIGATVTWSARYAANMTPATAQRWASRGRMQRAHYWGIGVAYGALGAYFLFLAATHLWDRDRWNYWAQTSEQFLQTYRGAEHRLLEELASYKENPPRAELADWGFSWSFGIDFVTSTKPAPRHFDRVPIILYCTIGVIWFVGAYLTLLSSRRHAWLTTGWEQIWPSIKLTCCSSAPFAVYCFALWIYSMQSNMTNPVEFKQVRAAASLATITERMNHWATDNGYVEGDHYQWLVREIPGHKDLATAKITQFWQPSVFDRWTITRRGLVRKSPHIAIRIVANSNQKETVVDLSMPSNATDSPESIPLRDALASLVEALETGPKTSN